MRKNLYYLLPLGLLFSLNVQAAPGEFWELTTSMEGMGMSMPAQTSKECLPLKDEGQPAGVNKDCKVTDLKPIPNGSTWKMSCKDGSTGSGTQTRIKDAFTSDVTMNMRDGSMKMSTKGKRIGGSCDTEGKMKAAVGEACEQRLSSGSAAALPTASDFIKPGGLCAGKKDAFCGMVRQDLSKDYKLHQQIMQLDSTYNVIKPCGLDVESARQTHCKAQAGNRSALAYLDQYCPAEAKALREAKRKQGGRSFSGRSFSGSDSESASSGNSSGSGSGSSGNAATNAVEQGKKALKGLKDVFGF